MCGRYSLFTTPEDLAKIFHLPPEEVRRLFDPRPRYNVAPTDTVHAIRRRRHTTGREPAAFHWGLIPGWANDPRVGARMINARAETLAQKPAFRDAFRARRCLILADGFYEWQRVAGGKQPHYIKLLDGRPLAFAGLWERWEDDRYGPIESCTIVTTRPNELVRPLHDRMPVIVDPSDHDLWLDPEAQTESLDRLLVPYRADLMEAYPVSALVNRPANDVPECIQPLDAAS